MTANEIKKLLGNEKLLIGRDEVLKNLRLNKIQKIFVSSNYGEAVLSDVMHLAENLGVEVETLELPNDELGVFCKKPFSVSVIGILR